MGVYKLEDIRIRFRFFFVEHIVDAMMKPALVQFLWILGIQYMIGSVFSLSVILKPRRLVYSVLSSIISTQQLLALQ